MDEITRPAQGFPACTHRFKEDVLSVDREPRLPVHTAFSPSCAPPRSSPGPATRA